MSGGSLCTLKPVHGGPDYISAETISPLMAAPLLRRLFTLSAQTKALSTGQLLPRPGKRRMPRSGGRDNHDHAAEDRIVIKNKNTGGNFFKYLLVQHKVAITGT